MTMLSYAQLEAENAQLRTRVGELESAILALAASVFSRGTDRFMSAHVPSTPPAKQPSVTPRAKPTRVLDPEPLPVYEKHLLAIIERHPGGISKSDLARLANRSERSSRFIGAVLRLQREAWASAEHDVLRLIVPPQPA